MISNSWLGASLAAGGAVPFLYFGTQLAVGLATPGYSFTRQAASDLGADGAEHAAWFNLGAGLTGVAALIAAIGFVAVVAGPSGRRSSRVLTVLTALAVASTGLAAVAAAAFPLPDARHGGGAVGAGMFLLPLLAAALLWVSWGAPPRAYGIANLALFAAAAALLSGAAGLDPNTWQGAMQRLLAVTVFVPIGVVSLLLRRHVARAGELGAG